MAGGGSPSPRRGRGRVGWWGRRGGTAPPLIALPPRRREADMRSTTDQDSWAGDYEAFIRRQSRGAARAEPPPATRDGWERRLGAVRDRLRRSLGRMPETPAPLVPEVLGTL